MKLSALTPAVILFAILSISTLAFAETDVDFATTHQFQDEIVNNQYTFDALTPNSMKRWNYDSPVGTPVTITFAFAGKDFGYSSSNDVKRNWYQYGKVLF